MEIRPSWWRIYTGVIGGIGMVGAITIGVLAVVLYLARSVAGDATGPTSGFRFYEVAIIYAVLPFSCWGGQVMAAFATCWIKALWLSAAVQSLLFGLFFWEAGPGLIPALLVPWPIAYWVSRSNWLPTRLASARARHAALFPRE